MQRENFTKWAFGGLLAACLLPVATPALALGAGSAVALGLGNPFAAASGRAAKWLLQGCVVLLGFSMDLGVLLRAGREGLVMAAVTISATFLLGALLGRWLRVQSMVSLLVSAGTAICGGSAIAAVGSVTRAKEAEMTVAMGTVFLLNGLALVLFPIVGHALGFDGRQFGAWAGIAIHDISSVVGAAQEYGRNSMATAAAVKLSRALWIVPVACVLVILQRRRVTGVADGAVGFAADGATQGRVQVPWFIGLFLLAGVVRSLFPAIAAEGPLVSHVATRGLTVALFLIGAGLSRRTLAAVGWRALLQGVVLWVAVSVGSAIAVLAWVR